MILALSSEVAPQLSLLELSAACMRRGVPALQLVEGHAHGVRLDDTAALRDAWRTSAESGVRIVAFETDDASNYDPAVAATACTQLGATLRSRKEVSDIWAAEFQRRGGRLLRAVETNAAEANVADAISVHWGSLTTADSLIVLRGSGPEAFNHEGQGIGSLLASLAVRGYRGMLSLAPSSPATLSLWRTWLNHRKASAGCGSKQSSHELVQLR